MVVRRINYPDRFILQYVSVEVAIIWGLPWWFSGKDSTSKTRDTGDEGLILGLERFPGEGHGNPLQYSCLENPWTEEPGEPSSMGLQRVRHV